MEFSDQRLKTAFLVLASTGIRIGALQLIRIEDIKIDMNELNKKLKTTSIKQRFSLIRKHAGGVCTRCSDIPTKKISYDIGDALLVEWYCDNCFNFRIDRSKKFIDKLN